MQTSLKQFVCLLFIQFAAIGCALAQERGTADQAKALVEKGLAHIKSVGVEKAAEDFSNKDGKWHEKDLYVFVQKFDGNTIAHGGNKGLVGKNMLDLKDANGQTYIDADVLAAAGITDLSRYGGGDDPIWDIFVDKKMNDKS